MLLRNSRPCFMSYLSSYNNKVLKARKYKINRNMIVIKIITFFSFIILWKIEVWSWQLPQEQKIPFMYTFSLKTHFCVWVDKSVYERKLIIFKSFFPSLLFTLSQFRTYTSGTYNPNARGSDACRLGQQTKGQNTLNVCSAQCQDDRQGQHMTEHGKRTHTQSRI